MSVFLRIFIHISYIFKGKFKLDIFSDLFSRDPFIKWLFIGKLITGKPFTGHIFTEGLFI